MNSSERECLGKKTASRNWFLESPIKWFVLSSRKTCEFFKQDQIQQFSTHYQLRGMASTSLLVNSFLGRTLADFYSWSHLHTLAENCFAPPSLHSHMCEVEHVNSPRKTAGSVIASNTFRQERKSPKAIWLSSHARYWRYRRVGIRDFKKIASATSTTAAGSKSPKMTQCKFKISYPQPRSDAVYKLYGKSRFWGLYKSSCNKNLSSLINPWS